MFLFHAVRSAAVGFVISSELICNERKGGRDLELDGEYGWKPLDRESFVGLLRDFATFLTGPIFNRDVLRLRKPVHVPPSLH
jgi:hypothetical protein